MKQRRRGSFGSSGDESHVRPLTNGGVLVKVKSMNKTNALSTAALPEFISVVAREEQIKPPPGTVGRCHTSRIYGSGSGRIAWSPVTKHTLQKSGWLPRGADKSPTVYTVTFVGECSVCKKEGLPQAECRHPIAARRLTGDVVVDLVAGKTGDVRPLSFADFERADMQHKRTFYKPHRIDSKDGEGPATLCKQIDDHLTLAVGEIGRLRRQHDRGEASMAELNRGLFANIYDAKAAIDRLRGKISRRRNGKK